MSAAIRNTLRVFSWARAQFVLRQAGGPAGFSAAAELIALETGVALSKVRAVLAGGFSSSETQARVAKWNGLKRATKHNSPILVPDLDAEFERGEGQGVAPQSPEEALRRVQTYLAQKGAM